MVYERQSWVDQSTILDASMMTHIEDGVVANDGTATAAQTTATGAMDAATAAQTELTDWKTGTGWTTISLASGISTPVDNTAQYMIRGGVVYFRGTVEKSGGFPSGWTTISTLPAACWPSTEMLRPGASSTMAPILRVTAAGTFRIYVPTATSDQLHISPLMYALDS